MSSFVHRLPINILTTIILLWLGRAASETNNKQHHIITIRLSESHEHVRAVPTWWTTSVALDNDTRARRSLNSAAASSSAVTVWQYARRATSRFFGAVGHTVPPSSAAPERPPPTRRRGVGVTLALSTHTHTRTHIFI